MSDFNLTIPAKGSESHTELVAVLGTSLYPGAAPASINMVIEYCRYAKLDPLLKPCHIVPMWDRATKSMRDVVMPGIGLYRIQASRTGCAGITEPEFGPLITKDLDGTTVTFPEWAKVTVSRIHPSGVVSQFTAREYWMENYAVRGGQDKSIAPNAMWKKRVYGQLAKCAEAQALRKGFPEVGAAPTAEEMEGKEFTELVNPDTGEITAAPAVKMPASKKATAAEIAKDTIIDVAATEVPQEPIPESALVEQNRPISAGALSLIRRMVAKANKGSEGDLCKRFLIEGDSFDAITESQFKDVKAHLMGVA